MKNPLLTGTIIFSLFFMVGCKGEPDVENFKLRNLETSVDTTTATAQINIGLRNISVPFEMSGINCTIGIDGKTLISFANDPEEIIIVKKGDKDYKINVNASAAKDVNMANVLKLFVNESASSICVKYKSRIAIRGGTKVLSNDLICSKISDKASDKLNKHWADFLSEKIVGLPFDDSIKGSISSFQVNSVNIMDNNVFSVKILLGVDAEKVPMGCLDIKNLKAELKIDNATFVTLSSVKKQSIEKGDHEYLLNLEGKIAPDFNPCILLGYMQDERNWPKACIEGSLNIPSLLNIPIRFSRPLN